MNARPTLLTALAVLCALSIGVSATSLESSVGTDPDDVIDLDWEQLPIGEETAAELKEEIDGNGQAESTGPGGSGDTEPQSRAGTGSPEAGSSGGDEEPLDSAAQQAADTVPEEGFPWDLLWLLLAVLLLIGLGAVAYRYSDRFSLGADRSDGGADPPPWPPDGATTEVDRAWFAMVRRLDVDRPWTRTPAEFAAAAVDAGMDPEAVHAVTSAFTDVRYGGASVSSAHRERAREGLRQLDVDTEGVLG